MSSTISSERIRRFVVRSARFRASSSRVMTAEQFEPLDEVPAMQSHLFQGWVPPAAVVRQAREKSRAGSLERLAPLLRRRSPERPPTCD